MSRDRERAFRHPSSEEVLKLMENAHRERSIAIARLLGLGPRRPVAGSETTVVCGAAA